MSHSAEMKDGGDLLPCCPQMQPSLGGQQAPFSSHTAEVDITMDDSSSSRVADRVELEQLMKILEVIYSPSHTPQVFFDKYSRPLGWGVSAQVFKIQWDDGSPGAVKEFKVKNNANHDKVLRTIHQELDILGRLNHPSIVNPIGVDWDRRFPSVFLPFYPQSFSSFVKSHSSPFSGESVLIWREVAKQLLDAVTYLHKNNIMHGDIKPENIMIKSEHPLRLVLCDFGSSIDLTQQTNKPMSGLSEQWANESLANSGIPSPASDLYAVGLCLYWCFTRENPWINEHPLLFIQEGQKPPITPPQESFPIPQDLYDLILSLMDGTIPSTFHFPTSGQSALSVARQLGTAFTQRNIINSVPNPSLHQIDLSFLAKNPSQDCPAEPIWKLDFSESEPEDIIPVKKVIN